MILSNLWGLNHHSEATPWRQHLVTQEAIENAHSHKSNSIIKKKKKETATIVCNLLCDSCSLQLPIQLPSSGSCFKEPAHLTCLPASRASSLHTLPYFPLTARLHGSVISPILQMEKLRQRDEVTCLKSYSRDGLRFKCRSKERSLNI